MRFKYICAVIAISLAMTGSAHADQYVMNRIVAKVNGEIITEYDLQERVDGTLLRFKHEGRVPAPGEMETIKKKILDQMIQERLLGAEVERYGITVSEADLDAEIERMRKQYNMDEETFAAQLEKEGTSMKEFRDKLRKSIEKQQLLSGMVASKIVVTETEVREEYAARKDQYFLGGGMHLAVIMPETEAIAEEIKGKLDSGDLSFEDAAAQYSTGPGNDQGGDIGEVSWDNLDSDWRAALDGMEAGDVKGPVDIQGGPVIVKLIERKEGTYVPFEDVQKKIYDELLKNKREESFANYLEELKEKAVIRYMN